MIRLLKNYMSAEWMYGPLKTVRVSKKTGVVQRLYKYSRGGALKTPRHTIVTQWEQVDGITMMRLPTAKPRIIAEKDRFWTAMSAI